MAMAASAPLGVGKAAVAAPAASYRATVLSVGDGDSLRVQAGERSITIRLACIDAPETAQAPWGQQSRAYLMQRLPRGREVSIQPHTTDRYGRTVAEVISDININLVMVEDGQAFAYRRYLSRCDAKEYLEAEFRARWHRYGVWQVEGGITLPWDFRRQNAAARIPDGTTPDGRRYHCQEIGSDARAHARTTEGRRSVACRDHGGSAHRRGAWLGATHGNGRGLQLAC